MPNEFEIGHAITAVLSRAQELREAGVLKFALDGLSVEFAPHTPEIGGTDDKPETHEEPKPRSIWDEPDLYGGGKPPGIRKEK